jgi:hypothetical protein
VNRVLFLSLSLLFTYSTGCFDREKGIINMYQHLIGCPIEFFSKRRINRKQTQPERMNHRDARESLIHTEHTDNYEQTYMLDRGETTLSNDDRRKDNEFSKISKNYVTKVSL